MNAHIQFNYLFNKISLICSGVLLVFILSFTTAYASTDQILDESINMKSYPKIVGSQSVQNGDIVLSEKAITKKAPLDSSPVIHADNQINKALSFPKQSQALNKFLTIE